MRKKAKWVLLLFTIMCCIGFAAYCFLSQRSADKTAPEISFQTDSLSVPVQAETADLLDGVSAWDAQDGDVTASLVVEGISGISDDQMATVTYAAFDRAGNVSKAQLRIHYTEYHSPRFSLEAPLLFRSGTSFDVLRYISAEDVIDGQLDDRIKATLVSGGTSINTEGVHEVEFRVTNSMKDTAYLTMPVEVYPAGLYNATLELSDYLIYLEKNSQFDSDSYLKTLKTGTEVIALDQTAKNVSVTCESDVDIAVVGCYSVTYTVKYGSYTGYSRLIVVVEE